MNKKDKKIQEDLVNEMIKVSETNPDVMIYMQSLMKCYEDLENENQQLKKQKDDVVEAIKGILEINNNYSIEKLVPFYSRKWVEDTQSDLLRMLGEIDNE